MTMRGSEYKKLNEISFLMGLVRGITVRARIYIYVYCNILYMRFYTRAERK